MVTNAALTSKALPACVNNFAQMGRQEGEKMVTGLDPPESDNGRKSPPQISYFISLGDMFTTQCQTAGYTVDSQ